MPNFKIDFDVTMVVKAATKFDAYQKAFKIHLGELEKELHKGNIEEWEATLVKTIKEV